MDLSASLVFIFFVLVSLVVGLVLVVLLALWTTSRQWARKVAGIEQELLASPVAGSFDSARLEGLPAPARRYLRHSLRDGAPLARVVRLVQRGRMKPREDRPHVELAAEEVLAPGRGLVWRARSKMGLLPFGITDHYYHDDGAVRVEALGLIPLAWDRGSDVDRSSRGRVAMEVLWCPSALVAREGDAVRWEPLDDERVRLLQTIDGEELAVTLAVDEAGRLTQMSMERWGNVGRSDFGPIPYGFEVLEEQTFGGCTIPSRLRGGWWFGTDRYVPDNASEFVIVRASCG